MLEGVVQGGTASIMREVGKPIAGKTGTTSDGKDVWFIGFSSDLVVGLYLGYDKPRSLGRAAQGGHTAAPIVKDFMKLALADKPAIPFKIPPGIRLVRIDAKSGLRPAQGEGGRTILEAFRPGTAPPEGYAAAAAAVPGFPDVEDGTRAPQENPQVYQPDNDNIMRPGTGRLY